MKCHNCNGETKNDVCERCLFNLMNELPKTIKGGVPKPPVVQPKEIYVTDLDNIPILIIGFIVALTVVMITNDSDLMMKVLSSIYVGLLIVHTIDLLMIRYHYKRGDIK